MNNKIAKINLQQICDPRGNLSVAEENIQVPFKIGRMQWLCLHPNTLPTIPMGNEAKMLVALSGSIRLHIEDTNGGIEEIIISNPNQAVLILNHCKCNICSVSEKSLLLIINEGSAFTNS